MEVITTVQYSTAEKMVTGRLLPTDTFFQEGDTACQMIQRLGVFDIDSEELCHNVVKKFTCYDPGCNSIEFNSVMEFDLHYNSLHRHSCATCKKSFASAHLLDLHIEETHDSFFAVQAERKPMYRCFVESCTSRFSANPERHNHCIEQHAFPSNFRWKTSKPSKKKSKSIKQPESIDLEVTGLGMDHDGVEPCNTGSEARKHIKGISFGRATKKSFVSKNVKSTDWHKKDSGCQTSNSKSVLEGSELSVDLMDSLPN